MFTPALTRFLDAETGAITVDWVVLTAALVGLGLAVISVLSPGLESLSGEIDTTLTNQTIADAFTPGEALVQSSVD